MLVEFTTKNFLSFRNEVTFSMSAARPMKETLSTGSGMSNLVSSTDSDESFLRIAAIYGANSSGKSNLVKSMGFFRNMVLNSVSNDRLLSGFSQNQFMLDDESNQQSSGFEMVFIIGETRFRYGFEILDESVESEWLFMQEPDSQKESYCFKRESGTIQVNVRTFKEAKPLENLTRTNALFLSTAAQFNVTTALRIREWFTTQFNIISGIDEQTLNYTALQYMNDETMRVRILDFIKLIDLGIQNISVKEKFIDSLGDSALLPNDPVIRKIVGGIDSALNTPGGKIRELDIKAEHNKYSGDDISSRVAFPLGQESIGTIKIFALIGPWLDTLRRGGTLIVDEFGASIHTKLALELIRLFQSRLNRGDAQLIVTTHDTNLLRKDLLRRDQIWFAEKDARGVSDLYSLVEYKINQATSVRGDASFGKDYLLGKYGAIPYFGNIPQFIADYATDATDATDTDDGQ